MAAKLPEAEYIRVQIDEALEQGNQVMSALENVILDNAAPTEVDISELQAGVQKTHMFCIPDHTTRKSRRARPSSDYLPARIPRSDDRCWRGTR